MEAGNIPRNRLKLIHSTTAISDGKSFWNFTQCSEHIRQTIELLKGVLLTNKIPIDLSLKWVFHCNVYFCKKNWTSWYGFLSITFLAVCLILEYLQWKGFLRNPLWTQISPTLVSSLLFLNRQILSKLHRAWQYHCRIEERDLASLTTITYCNSPPRFSGDKLIPLCCP